MSNQQDWLLKAIEILKGDFEQIGETIPKEIMIKVEYPDNIPHNWLGRYEMRRYEDESIYRWIFINPSVDGLQALDTLVHELVHAATDTGVHCEEFMRVAAAIGLDDAGLSTCAEEVLLKRLKEIKEMLGEYPRVGALV